MKEIMVFWTVLGYAFVVLTPRVFIKRFNRFQAVIYIIVSGPLAWIVFIPATIKYFIKRGGR